MCRSNVSSEMHLVDPHSTRAEHYRKRMPFPEGSTGYLDLQEGLDTVVLLFPEVPHTQETN